MRQRFKVTPDKGEPWRVTADGRDFLTWERAADEGDERSIIRYVRDRKPSDMYEVAFYASTRQKLYSKSLAEFEKTVDVDTILDAAEADPTQPAATAEP